MLVGLLCCIHKWSSPLCDGLDDFGKGTSSFPYHAHHPYQGQSAVTVRTVWFIALVTSGHVRLHPQYMPTKIINAFIRSIHKDLVHHKSVCPGEFYHSAIADCTIAVMYDPSHPPQLLSSTSNRQPAVWTGLSLWERKIHYVYKVAGNEATYFCLGSTKYQSNDVVVVMSQLVIRENEDTAALVAHS